MKLRKPCPHDKYDAHFAGPEWCPGGVFLPDDTRLIEWFEYVIRLWGTDLNDAGVTGLATELLDVVSNIIDGPCEHGFIVSHMYGEPGRSAFCSGRALSVLEAK